ncbi:hypothetical protein [Chryseobacterium sp. HSC-36S06]|uniref:hypothetical protein n=1 Tax=Chryseobacterium sp. HSC-36S06 TaxID=2910970 RepID=UPI0020A1CEA5|nr:hypothetical protein [Chryseobacterium sp. HSC-36S06]MCP2039220.1 hypothetical protein [Chryseobacterium sp. HSC-36S06]
MKEDFKIEFDKQTQKSITIFFLIFGIFIVFIGVREYYYGYNLRYESLINEDYTLKVDRVYINSTEHNFKYVAFTNGKQQLSEFGYQKNDSIVKKKGDSIEYIYRDDKIISNNVLDLLRDYEKKK